MVVGTWNMQGATGLGESKWRIHLASLFNQTPNLGLICLQECGEAPLTAEPIDIHNMWATAEIPLHYGFFSYNLGTQSRPDIYYILIAFTAMRTSLGIITRQMPHAFYCAGNPAPFAAARPALGVDLGNGRVIYTLHAISPNGPNAPTLVNQIHLNTNPSPWIILGDYNRVPGSFALPANVGYIPHNPDNTMRGGNHNLDYALFFQGFYNAGIVLTDITISDHYPVLYDIG